MQTLTDEKMKKNVIIYAANLCEIDTFPPDLPVALERLTQIRKIAHPEARRKSLVAELLLCWAVRQFYPNMPPLARQTNPYGKPFFSALPNFHFNLSHSRDWVILGIADIPIGVDIEFCAQPKPQIVQRFFHPNEQNYFFSLPEADWQDGFYSLWVLKESAVKAFGLGMHFPFCRFSVSLPDLQLSNAPGHAQLALPKFYDTDYRLGICTLDSIPIKPAVHILSPETILCK